MSLMHVTIIESHIHIPYYHKLTELQFGAAQCLAASGPIAVLSNHRSMVYQVAHNFLE